MKKIFFAVILMVCSLSVFSQGSMTALQYSIGFGTGDMKEYIGPASFRGFTLDYRELVTSNIAVGVDVGWNVFFEELPDDVYKNDNLTISGKQWRYGNHFPMLGAVDYFFNMEERFAPFAGLGIGTMYSKQNTDMGVYSYEKDAWHFAMRPEIGVLINASPGIGFKVSGKYYYGFKAGDLPAQGYFTLNFGFVFVP